MRSRAVAGLLASLIFVSAQGGTASASASPRVAADEVAVWCDAMFAPMLAHRRYSGLAVVVVQDGAVLVSKGYGFADAARGTPLMPERTRLRIGSITKTMTATIILQLLAEGRIRSLDDPANDYLRRYKLPDYHDVPVTLRHLLTHTGGFESLLLGLGTERITKAPADAAYIRQVMPQPVRAPGGQPVYSNFGFETLGAVVEDLTGQTMAEVMAQRLFGPLGMSASVLPYGVHPSPDLGQPYAFFPNGELQPVPYVALHPFAGPAGGVEATPADIARYMIAQLDENAASDHPILPSRLLHEMHQRQAGANRSVPGFGLGIFVGDRDGVRIVDHPGDWPGFDSLMSLFPDRGLGIFISVMAAAPVPSFAESLFGSARLRATAAPAVERALSFGDLYEIREVFLDRFIGLRTPPPRMALDAHPMIGRYLEATRSHTSPESVLTLFWDPTIVRLARTDALEIGGSGPFYAIGRDSFALASTPPGALPSRLERHGFVRASTGEATYMVDGTGLGVSERVGTLDAARRLWRRYTMAVALLCLSTIALLRRNPQSGWQRIAQWLPLGIPLCLILQALVFFSGFAPGRSFFFELLAGHSERLAALVVLGDVMLVVALAMIVAAVAAWRLRFWGTGLWGRLARVHFTIAALAVAGLVPILWALNLMGLPRILQ